MSTELPSQPNPTRRQRAFEARIGETLEVLVAGRRIEAILVDVEPSYQSIHATLTLQVETDVGGLRVSPDAVVESSSASVSADSSRHH